MDTIEKHLFLSHFKREDDLHPLAPPPLKPKAFGWDPVKKRSGRTQEELISAVAYV